MFIRPCYRRKDGKRHAYWALVESARTASGPRQRVVAYLGQMPAAQRRGVKETASGTRPSGQRRFIERGAGSLPVEPEEIAEVQVSRVRVERSRAFGGPWLGWELARRVGLDGFLREAIPAGREEVPWAMMALTLVLGRLCDPSSELRLAEHVYRHGAFEDVLGVPVEKVNDDRLYRALDALLPHKEALQVFLKERLGRLFDLKYDLILYDATSTYFEGEAAGNALAQRGYSRDHRPDCRQVCVALVVSKEGMPLGYEVFAGNRTDVTTLEEMVETMERRYGRSDRIWVMDRGMISEDNMEFLGQEGRRYIVGTPRPMLKHFERSLLGEGWETIREGLEVKRCPGPGGAETFILCRSRDRREKEKAMHERFEKRIEKGLEKIAQGCRRRRQDPLKIAGRVGALMGANSRAAGLFDVDVKTNATGGATVAWKKVDVWRDWAALSEGCYLLRSNVNEWSAEELWTAYIQLTEAEAAFRIHKSDLSLRPIWHQKAERVQAHILVCFLAYVLWKTLGQLCRRAGIGDEPRRVFDELGQIRVVDVVMPTKQGPVIRKRCVTRPTDHQAILLQRLGLHLPSHIKLTSM
jgi:transposase